MDQLFRCDQCGFEEYRPEDDETWLCMVCGWMRWTLVDDDPTEERPSTSRDRTRKSRGARKL